MSYGMTFAESVSEKDRLLNDDSGFALTIDPVAFSYLQGAEIDYQDSDVNATFVFNNVFQAVGGSGACAGCGGALIVRLDFRRPGRSSDRPADRPWIGRHETDGFRSFGRP